MKRIIVFIIGVLFSVSVFSQYELDTTYQNKLSKMEYGETINRDSVIFYFSKLFADSIVSLSFTKDTLRATVDIDSIGGIEEASGVFEYIKESEIDSINSKLSHVTKVIISSSEIVVGYYGNKIYGVGTVITPVVIDFE